MENTLAKVIPSMKKKILICAHNCLFFFFSFLFALNNTVRTDMLPVQDHVTKSFPAMATQQPWQTSDSTNQGYRKGTSSMDTGGGISPNTWLGAGSILPFPVLTAPSAELAEDHFGLKHP